MAEMTSTPVATPKRKREDIFTSLHFATTPSQRCATDTVFSFRPLSLQPTSRSNHETEDGNISPRSKVAQKFGGLAIRESGEGPASAGGGKESESGGGADAAARVPRWLGRQTAAAPAITRFHFDAGTTTTAQAPTDMQLDVEDDDAAASRKRTKTFEPDTPVAEPATNNTPAGETSNLAAQTPFGDNQADGHLSVSIDPSIIGALRTDSLGNLQKSYPSINRLADSKSRSRRRAGTPPASSRRKGNSESRLGKDKEHEGRTIVDPVRAALTWREDEITVYDPADRDDDGTGINGIGFKPTAAVAHQRAQKRRQQLAEYKKREESEARTRRNQRRRERPGGAPEMTRRGSVIRVHFSEAPPTTVMTT